MSDGKSQRTAAGDAARLVVQLIDTRQLDGVLGRYEDAETTLDELARAIEETPTRSATT